MPGRAAGKLPADPDDLLLQIAVATALDCDEPVMISDYDCQLIPDTLTQVCGYGDCMQGYRVQRGARHVDLIVDGDVFTPGTKRYWD